MYSYPFNYHRAKDIREASDLLAQLGAEAKLLAGGQSLIPLMKFRLAAPDHLVDLNFIPQTSYIKDDGPVLRFGAMTRHAEIEQHPLTSNLPILGDCASGIADVQVRNRGTLGGSIAEADPSGDWAPVLLTLDTQVTCQKGTTTRTLAFPDFLVDSYQTALEPSEVVTEIIVEKPAANSGGAYTAFKRSAQVYASASVAVQLTLSQDKTVENCGIALGSVGLTTIIATTAEKEILGQPIGGGQIEKAAEAAAAASDPQSDMRGSVPYKRNLVRALVKRALEIAVRRCEGERVEGGHIYA